MAKIVQFHGAAPAGWSRERWAWLKSLTRDDRLSALARLLAWVMATQFAPRDLPECSPGIDKLCDAVAMQKRAVMGALAELVAAGWLERGGGNSPGKRAVYRFTSGEQVHNHAPEQVHNHAPEQVHEIAPTGAPNCTRSEFPPAPPYKELPNMNQKPAPRFATKIVVPGGQRPTQLCAFVPAGSDFAAEWSEWLEARGLPGLDRIGKRVRQGQAEGFDMPTKRPPTAGDRIGEGIADRFARWLVGLPRK